MTTVLEYELEERQVSFVVDEELYPLDALYGACYLFVDRCYVFLDRPADKKVAVRLRSKGPAEEAELEDLVEKPAVDQAPSNLAVAARYICRPSIFDRLARTKPGKGNEIQLTDALRMSIREGGRILGVQLAPGEKRYDVGNFESYYDAFLEAALADPQYGPSVAKTMRRLIAEYPEE